LKELKVESRVRQSNISLSPVAVRVQHLIQIEEPLPRDAQIPPQAYREVYARGPEVAEGLQPPPTGVGRRPPYLHLHDTESVHWFTFSREGLDAQPRAVWTPRQQKRKLFKDITCLTRPRAGPRPPMGIVAGPASCMEMHSCTSSIMGSDSS